MELYCLDCGTLLELIIATPSNSDPLAQKDYLTCKKCNKTWLYGGELSEESPEWC